jgi:hypothetical protein
MGGRIGSVSSRGLVLTARVGQYRIIFGITGNQIRIFGIIHRKDVYQAVEKRLE